MCEPKIWTSPDNKIKKEIVTPGLFGVKPSDNCICTIEITNVECVNGSIHSEYLIPNETALTVNIGESNTALDREIDKCLATMHRQEKSVFVINHADGKTTLTLTLSEFESRGYIYEWDAKEKVANAQAHKEKGIELFKHARYVDASHRFSRGLKLLLSIPESVEQSPNEIDGVALTDLCSFRANLYNNLASCYLKAKKYDVVINLCTKVLHIEKNNVKALHKRAVAYSESNDFEKAKCDFVKILQLDPHNRAAQEKLQFVNSNINKQEASYASIIKKMFAK